MIIITSKRDGFRRCGMAHPAAATEYADDAFTGEQLKTLRAEPMLTVSVAGAESKYPADDARAQLRKDLKKKTVEQLTEMLDGVQIPAGAKKDELVELLVAAAEKPQE